MRTLGRAFPPEVSTPMRGLVRESDGRAQTDIRPYHLRTLEQAVWLFLAFHRDWRHQQR